MEDLLHGISDSAERESRPSVRFAMRADVEVVGPIARVLVVARDLHAAVALTPFMAMLPLIDPSGTLKRALARKHRGDAVVSDPKCHPRKLPSAQVASLFVPAH
jgi:hypothetical protein